MIECGSNHHGMSAQPVNVRGQRTSRVETVKSTRCVIRALEEYDLVFNTACIGGV